MKKYGAALLVGLLLQLTNLQACTLAFENNYPGAKVVARSMDFYIDDVPTLVVYPRGVTRKCNPRQNPPNLVF